MWRLLKLVSSLMLCFGLTGAVSVASQRKPLTAYPCLFIDGWQVRLDTKQWEAKHPEVFMKAFINTRPTAKVNKATPSPNKDYVAFVVTTKGAEPELYIGDVRTRRYHLLNLIDAPPGVYVQLLTWSLDSQLLLIGYKGKSGGFHIISSTVEGKTALRLTYPTKPIFEGWTASGRLVLRTQAVSPEESEPNAAFNRVEVIAVPDFRLVNTIVVAQPLTILRQAFSNDFAVWFLRDRTRLAFLVGGAGDQTQLTLTDADGTTLHTYTIAAGLQSPILTESPDYRYLAVRGFRQSPDGHKTVTQLDVIDTQRHTIAPVTDYASSAPDMVYIVTTEWSMDSRVLYHVEHPDPSQRSLFAYDLSSPSSRLVLSTPYQTARFSPQRTHFLFVDTTSSTALIPMLLPLSENASPIPLLPPSRTMNALNDFQYTWATDGETLLLNAIINPPLSPTDSPPIQYLSIINLRDHRHDVYVRRQNLISIGTGASSTDSRYVAYMVRVPDRPETFSTARKMRIMLLDIQSQRTVYLFPPLQSGEWRLVLKWLDDNGSILVQRRHPTDTIDRSYQLVRLDGSVLDIGKPPFQYQSQTVEGGECEL